MPIRITRTQTGTHTISGLSADELQLVVNGLHYGALSFDAALAPAKDPGGTIAAGITTKAAAYRTLRRTVEAAVAKLKTKT